VNQFGFGVQSGQDFNQGLGGNSATPSNSFTILNGAAGGDASHPWKVSINEDDEITIDVGTIATGLLEIPEGDLEDPGDLVMTEDQVLYIKIEGDPTTYVFEVGADDLGPIDDSDLDNIISYYPIAQATSSGIEQFCRNNLAATLTCKDGEGVNYLLAL
jgi:hypothetical protein